MQTTYSSAFSCAILSIGFILDFSLMSDCWGDITREIDISSVIVALNAFSTFVECFADVSTYGIFNESASF